MFIHTTVSRIVHGKGCIAQAPEEVRRLGGSRVLIVTDSGLADFGVQKPLEKALEKAGMPFHLYAEAEIPPSVAAITRCAATAKSFGADALLGIGGGSALDTTKAAALLLTNEGPVSRYFDSRNEPGPLPPLLLVPTTASGSEMNSVAELIAEDGSRRSVVADSLHADVVLLDPDLTISLPAHLTAMAGAAAFVSSMESYVGKAATLMTDNLNTMAMQLIVHNIRQAYVNGGDRDARVNMLYASALAGMGVSNTQSGIIHAVAEAVPPRYRLPQTLLTACLAPMCMEFNALARPEKYARISMIFGEQVDRNVFAQAKRAAVHMLGLLSDIDLGSGLAAYGIERRDLPGIAERAAGNVRLMGNNPRPATAQQILELLEANHR